MSYKITGKLHLKGSVQAVSEKFRKREFILEFCEKEPYHEFIKFELTQDSCERLDNFQLGTAVTVEFNIRGREYTDKRTGEIKYFTSLNAWKLSALATETKPTSAAPPVPAMPEDDIPF